MNFGEYCFLVVAIAFSFATADSEINLLRGLKTGVHYNLLTALGFLATAVGLAFAALQLRQGAREQRAQFLIDLTERYFADNDIRKFYYRLDWHDRGDQRLGPKFVFDDKFIGSNEERWLDQLLYTFDVIGHVVRMGALTPSEAQIFAFQASRVINDPEVKRYLEWLNHEYGAQDRPTPAHADALYLLETLRKLHGGQKGKQTAAELDR